MTYFLFLLVFNFFYYVEFDIVINKIFNQIS